MNSNQASSELASGLTKVDPASDATPLIMTKIRIPRRRRDLLRRRRLIDFVHAHLDRKLILISAPAGYGKTSLLADFAHDTDLPVCWYTLDAFDRDLRLFLEHLFVSIAHRFPAFGERSCAFLKSIPDPSQNLYSIVATVVREIYDVIPEYFVLILDDHHTVEDQEQISRFLDLFINYVDENCHLILASRTLPALPNLSLLVARQQAAGLSIDELCFTSQEIQALAQQNYGLELTSEQAELLAHRTGGWITGLLLTVVPRWEQRLEEVPTGGRINVGLYDYLSKQVLDQQPAVLRDFLLASSVLDELSPDLCNAVLGIDKSADLMTQLRLRNLFITEFEGDDNRLSYHDLFREFLRATLRQQDEARFWELTHQAAQAYTRRSEWERAASRYLMLQDYESVVQIMEQTAMHMYASGRWDTLAGWVDALPSAIRMAHPRLLVHRGKIHMDRGEHAAALALYDQADQAFRKEGAQAQVAQTLVQKSCILRFQGHYTEAVSHCRAALALVSGTTPQEKFIIALAHRNTGLCQFRLGHLGEGLAVLQEALRSYEELGAVYDVGMVHHDLGLGLEMAGDLEQAVDHYEAALQCWQRLGSAGPWANTLNGLGVVYHLQGKYDEALRILGEALTRAQQAGDSRVEAFTWASLGDLHRDLGAYEQARQTYAQGLQVAKRTGVGFILTYVLDALGNVSRLQGNLSQAKKQLEEAMECAVEHGSDYETGLCHVSLGILACEEGDLMTAQNHLDQAIELFRAGGFKRDLVRASLHRAQVVFQATDRKGALAELEQTLALVGQLTSDQFLVAEGQRFLHLLCYAAEEGVGADIVPDLLERIEAHQRRVAERPEPVAQVEPRHVLKIHALGRPWVELDGQRIQWTTVQSRDLFFCLLQHPQGLRKEDLGRMFWPDHPPHRLDGIFRSTLYRLRRALFRESVVFEGGVYCFNWECDYWFDVKVFEELLDRADQEPVVAPDRTIALLEEALELYHGDYLKGVCTDWCSLEQERLWEHYLSALERLARLRAERGDLQLATELYQQLVNQDPYREAVHRELMLCHYRLGDRAAAIRQYRACARILREELGLSPSSETETLFLRIID